MPSPSVRMGRAGAGAWRAHDATPPGHDAPRRRAVQHHGDRRAALADDGWSHRAGEPRAVGDRDGDLLPAVGDGGARARRHRPRGRGHLSVGHPGVRPASRVSRRLGLLGEQPRLLPVAPAHERRDRGLRRGARVRAPRREQVVHRRVFARQPVDRGGAEPGRAAGGQVGAEPGCVRHLAAGGDLRAARPLVVRDARQRDAALVALLLTLGNLGGVGAWIAGTARIPFVAGVDRVLPPAFGKVHPRWQTPYVALLVQGGVATVFVVAGLAGSTVHDAYLALVDTTIVLFFIPYLYLFAAYLRLRRERTPLGQAAGWAGLVAVLLSIGLAFVPAADVANPLAFEAKVVGGVVGFMGAGLVLLRRPKRVLQDAV